MNLSRSVWRAPSLSLSRACRAFAVNAILLASSIGYAATPSLRMQDLGVAAPATTISAVVWLKGSNDSALDALADALSDAASPRYHQWMEERDISGYSPTSAEVAAVQASLTAFGLNVGKAYEGSSFVRVSGTVAQFQEAFGSPIHAFKAAAGKTLFKATSAQTFKGAHAELVGGVSGLSGVAIKPFVARQFDLSTGAFAPGLVPQAGTNPLGSFTSNCFGPVRTIKVSGLSSSNGFPGAVNATYKGPTYLDPTDTVNRPLCGYTAEQLVQHYGISEAHALGLRGRDQTVVIVVAYGSPNALADLNTFSHAMGLPKMTSSSFQVVYPNGRPGDLDTAADWALETTLDIEWVHAFAPEARIALVVAPSEDDAELAYAVEYAASHRLGNVISNSWGQPEAGSSPSTARMFNHVFKRAAARGIAVNVATGDSGDNGVGMPVGAAAIPADSPYATGVGGTSIDVPSDRGPVETAWGITLTQFGRALQPFVTPLVQGFLQGGGGGESVYLKKPSFQRKLPGMGRQLPDVSALGDPQTGAIVVETDPVSGAQTWYAVGGTSLATPIFSAIWALADQAAGESLGQAAPIVAAMPAFALRDVLPVVARKQTTSAVISFRGADPVAWTSAQLLGLDQSQPNGFASALIFVGLDPFTGWNDVGFGTDTSLMAAPGWDSATGYGVPNGLLFIGSAQLFGRRH